MPYLMNALMIFKGAGYYYLDHPGTPLEVIGTFIYVFLYPFTGLGGKDFFYYNIQYPNIFLVVSRLFISVSSLYCAFYLRQVFISSEKRNLGVLQGISVIFLFFVVHPMSLATLNLWSHTSFNYPFGTLLLAYLYSIAVEGREINYKSLIVLGVGSGFLAAVMVYFFAWVLCIFLFLGAVMLIERGWRDAFLFCMFYLFVAALTFLVFMLPAYGQVSYFINWIYGVVIHGGIYGQGQKSITSVKLLENNILLAFEDVSLLVVFFLVMSLFVSVLLFRKIWLFGHKRTLILIFAVYIQIIFLFLLIFKHPGVKYSLPIAAALPILAALLLSLSRSTPRLYTVVSWTLILFVLVQLPVTVMNFLSSQAALSNAAFLSSSQEYKMVREYQRMVYGDTKDPTVLSTYGTYSPCYSLQFGNEYANSLFNEEVSAVCPRHYQYIVWISSAFVNGKLKKINEVSWDMIITSTSILADNEYLTAYGNVVRYKHGVVIIYNPNKMKR
jgi:hypothetical protein